MLSIVVRPLRAALRALLAMDSPRQLAAGFALGMVFGLLPKGNLIALSVCVLLFSLRVNKGLAVVAAVAFTYLGTLTDSFTHKIGAQVLHVDSLQASFALLYNLPLGPWIGFQNTVVIGALVVGLYLAVPTYWVSYGCCRLLLPWRADSREADQDTQVVIRTDVASSTQAAPRQEAA